MTYKEDVVGVYINKKCQFGEQSCFNNLRENYPDLYEKIAPEGVESVGLLTQTICCCQNCSWFIKLMDQEEKELLRRANEHLAK